MKAVWRDGLRKCVSVEDPLVISIFYGSPIVIVQNWPYYSTWFSCGKERETLVPISKSASHYSAIRIYELSSASNIIHFCLQLYSL